MTAMAGSRCIRFAARAALLVVFAGAFAACASTRSGTVLVQYGGMREVMREGRDEARVRLSDLGPAEGLIAVGALAGLAGEVTADGSSWWIATADETRVAVEHEPGERAAALLTARRVAAWDETVVADPLDEARLGSLVERHLRERGRDPTEPWPLRIDGLAAQAELHVIRGDCPHAPEATIPAWRCTPAPGTPIVLVGFYAPGKEGLLTHHGTDFHLHAILSVAGAEVAGHLDSFELAPGARVRIARP
jgi:acetolactate decarboxylase